MKKIVAFIVLIFVCCSCSYKNAATKKVNTENMETDQLTLGVHEQKTIQLPSRGTSGLQLLFTIDDSSIVAVHRKELQSRDLDSLQLRAGDPVPAVFTIEGKKAGTTTIHFAERRVAMKDMPDLPLKDYKVTVTE